MAYREPLGRAPSVAQKACAAAPRAPSVVPASPVARARRALFGIDPEEATFARRGFRPTTPARQEALESIGWGFIAGYNAAVAAGHGDGVIAALGEHPAHRRGFVVEGAAMGLALLDLVTPWPRRRFAAFVAGPAQPYVYLAHVGAGWALARVSWRLRARLGATDPLLAWLSMDGYGFHSGYFAPARTLGQARRPRFLSGYEARAFDQGVGRALWFAAGAGGAAVRRAMTAFPADRRPDVWSGIGLAAAYAGGADADDLASLADAAGPWRPHLGQGAAFAAAAHLRAGTIPDFTDAACRALTGHGAAAAAAITLAAQPAVAADPGGQHYEAWRRAIRNAVATSAPQPGLMAAPDGAA